MWHKISFVSTAGSGRQLYKVTYNAEQVYFETKQVKMFTLFIFVRTIL